jgi:hypothetical protein
MSPKDKNPRTAPSCHPFFIVYYLVTAALETAQKAAAMADNANTFIVNV